MGRTTLVHTGSLVELLVTELSLGDKYMVANDFQGHMNTLSVLSVGAKVKGLISTDGLMLHADIMGDEDMVGTLLSLLASAAGKLGK